MEKAFRIISDIIALIFFLLSCLAAVGALLFTIDGTIDGLLGGAIIIFSEFLAVGSSAWIFGSIFAEEENSYE